MVVFDEAKEEILSSLKISSNPRNRDFWLGFILALEEHKLVTFEEFKMLGTVIVCFKS